MREAGRYEPCTSRFLEDFRSWKRLVNLLLDGSVVKNKPANAGDTRGVGSIPGLGRYPGGGVGCPLQYSKESACSMGDLGLIPGLGRSPGGGHGNPFQCSCLENPHGQRSLAGYSP